MPRGSGSTQNELNGIFVVLFYFTLFGHFFFCCLIGLLLVYFDFHFCGICACVCFLSCLFVVGWLLRQREKEHKV